MEDLEKRLRNGIKFFKSLNEGQYESSVVRKYLPQFMKLVEDYLDSSYEKAKKILK